MRRPYRKKNLSLLLQTVETGKTLRAARKVKRDPIDLGRAFGDEGSMEFPEIKATWEGVRLPNGRWRMLLTYKELEFLEIYRSASAEGKTEIEGMVKDVAFAADLLRQHGIQLSH